MNKESNSTKKIKSRSTLFSCSIGRKLTWVHVYIAGPHPPFPGKNNLSFLNSPVVPAGVIFRKCLTKSSLFSDFALNARPRIILFVSGSGLVKDAGSKCRVSWNWITISLTSLVEQNEMDWMELLAFSLEMIQKSLKKQRATLRWQTYDEGKLFVDALYHELITLPVPGERTLFEMLSYHNP